MRTASFLNLLWSIAVLFICSCASQKPKGVALDRQSFIITDYSETKNWAALPDRVDQADLTPYQDLKDQQAIAAVDVFFLHPTTYTGGKGEDQWNAPVNDQRLNEKTDAGSIKNQASIFNGAGRVYAPRYQQAHLNCYFTKDTLNAKRAFQLAYLDVKAAFEYYLKHYNQGRPIIIAAHSQGTNHGEQILQAFFDGKALQSQLVAAYLVGMPIEEGTFKNIKACETASATNCFCSWRTWKKKHFPKNHLPKNNIIVTNPLLWTTTEAYADKSLNEGSVLRKFEKSFYPKITDAQVKNGVLWINKPKFPGSFLVWFKNFHIADYNLFYVNVRKNAQLRAQTYLEKRGNRSF